MRRSRAPHRSHPGPKRPLVWVSTIHTWSSATSLRESLAVSHPSGSQTFSANFLSPYFQAERPCTLVAVKGLALADPVTLPIIPAVGVANPGDNVTGAGALVGVPEFLAGTGPNHFPAVGEFIDPYEGASDKVLNAYRFASKGMRKMDIGDIVYMARNGTGEDVNVYAALSFLFKL